MKHTLFILFYSLTFSLSAQVVSSDTLRSEYEPELIKIKTIDTTEWKPLSHPSLPEGLIYKWWDAQYVLFFQKPDTAYLVMPRMGYLYEDSTLHIQVNGKGSEELLLFFRYEYSGGSEFGGYETYGTGIQLYDLDARKLLLQYELSNYHSRSSAHYYDSLGNEVPLTEELRTAILEGDGEEYEYASSLTQEYHMMESQFNCTYTLKNKRFILDCISSGDAEEYLNELGDDRPEEQVHLEYRLKDIYWIRKKK